MDHKFTEQIKQWLETPETERDYTVGALYLLKLSGNHIMYRNIISQIDSRHDFVEYQLQKYLNFRLQALTHEQLQQIEKFASIYLKISDMAVILDIPADVLREDTADRSSDVSKAYRRGKAASKVKLHSQEMMLAQVGSPLAIENAHRNLLDMEDDE